MAIVAPIPGQEERNSDHLLEKGAAIKCNDFTTLPYKVDRLLQDPARLQTLRTNARNLGRPDAAAIIVQTLLKDEEASHPAVAIDPSSTPSASKEAKPSLAANLEKFFKFRKLKNPWKLE
jgi:hypothetical protein